MRVQKLSSSSLSKTLAASTLLVVLGAAAGCRVEHAPTRLEREETHQARLADVPLPTLPQPDVNDAERVIAACGQPNSDSVIPMYTKYYNGPVRHLEYVGKREVTLDFIPSRPRAELAYVEAPLPHEHSGSELPPNATWRFEEGHMEEETLVTSHRLGVYLPCAGEALAREF